MEDHQVNAYLAGRLRHYGCRAFLCKPEQICWRNGNPSLESAWYQGPMDLIVRFYQSEWLARLPLGIGWERFFRGGAVSVVNPALAVISESKRFPLVWDRLSTNMRTWRELLPETRDPRQVPWASDDTWLLKTAMCNNGDTVRIREMLRPAEWLQTKLVVHLRPGNWIVQKRFDSIPIFTPDGPRHVCIGIYTVNGQTVGAYARCSEKRVIDFAAVDVALLLDDCD
jgi:hypothetical protein